MRIDRLNTLPEWVIQVWDVCSISEIERLNTGFVCWCSYEHGPEVEVEYFRPEKYWRGI